MSRKVQVTVGECGWIHQQVTPAKYLAEGKLYEPAWLPQTYIGLLELVTPHQQPVLILPPTAPRNSFVQ